MEKVFDLLTTTKQGIDLPLKQHPKKGVFIQDVKMENFNDQYEFTKTMIKGFNSRHTGATKANARSSRSHTVIQVHMKMKNNFTHNERESTMNLIDLAGAERIDDTGATGKRLEEAKTINGSLSELGNVMNKLVERIEKPGVFVPFRNSKLTFLLKDALSGNCVTTLNCNMSARKD